MVNIPHPLTRGINFFNNRLQRSAGDWSYLQGTPLVRLRGRVFGVIGLGRIGTAAAVRAKALGMDVAFYDPYVNDGMDKALGIRRVESADELCRQAFVVSPHGGWMDAEGCLYACEAGRNNRLQKFVRV